MSLFDRLGHVVKAEWSSRFGEGDDDEDGRTPDEESLREAEEAARGRRGSPQSERAPQRASARARAVTDVMSACRMLELEPGATLDEVRAQYRSLAKRYHPRTLSKVPDQAHAAQTVLDALTEALEILEAHLLPLPDARRA